MTKKQTLAIALLCALALLLAGSMLWRAPESPKQTDAHGHDRAAADETAQGGAGARGIAMTAAQIQANGIALDTAGPATLRQRLHLPAQVKVDAERTVALAAPAQGIVQAVLVSPGSVVRKGQALVTIQSPAVASWRAEAARAHRRLALARTTYRREKTLWDERISARQDYEAAATAVQEAEIAAQAAAQHLAALGIEPGRAVSGSVTVRAPIAGVVVEKPAVAGQAVDDMKPLVTIADLSHVWVEAAVPADSLGQVGAGMAAKISVGTQPDEIDGTVAFLGPVLGETTRMATARIVLPNRDARLRPGMLASVDLLGPQERAPVTVASDAIQTIHEHSVVFVRTAAGFQARDVVPGASDGKRTAIVRGLESGAVVAAGGSFLLKADLGKSEAGHDD
ncbi:efflux RND transporter periplasmic adaptor subunit [Massilia rhizosphaerae]|uniref:efflux RND transporter periplasmic adaptor subunit n=1 Tax=Massilia rhizosphaerae TaxID=2784389 RepID=UPI0018DBFBF7|nr:efflux RND transporter periplasmic adaptor subunit [Massilia rhizosphaerae]